MSRSPYAPVQQRARQREAARIESLSTLFVPLFFLVTTGTAFILWVSAVWAEWELKTFSQVKLNYEPSPFAELGIFSATHKLELVSIGVMVLAIIVLWGAKKIASALK